jgi:hypothetical protein
MSIREQMDKGDKKQISFEEFLEAVFATEEYARPEDIGSAYTRGEVMNEGAYYPPRDILRKMRNY